MVHLIPANPTFTTESERKVWRQLKSCLPPEATLLAGVRITSPEQDHEADCVVLLPGAGVLVLEVKGGSVSYDGVWRQSSAAEQHTIDPVDQALRTGYALRSYVEGDPRWSRGRIVWAHGVITPYSTFPADFAAPDCPRWALHDRDDLDHAASRFTDNIVRSQQRHKLATADDLELVVEILQGRGFTTADLNAAAESRRDQADRLTREQADLLGVTRLLNRVEVRGGAGSGKTVLALAQARQLAAGRDGRKAQRVALLCYSIGLATHLKRQVQTWPRRHRPAFVGTWEELGTSWGAPSGTREDSDFWESRLPAIMGELASELEPGHRFDAFVVDEAQDFAETWWVPLIRAMRDETASGLFVYSDENQRIFARHGRPPVSLVPLVLDHNLRNTKQILQAFAPLAPSRMTPRGGEGVEVSFVPAGPDQDPVEVGDDAIDVLLDAGWHPGNIALLSTGSRHPAQIRETERLGMSGYWDSYFDADEVFYGHVLGCKGLERPAVVLVLNETAVHERSREKVYVGMSRATDHLIVVGRPEQTREMVGEQVTRTLGLPGSS